MPAFNIALRPYNSQTLTVSTAVVQLDTTKLNDDAGVTTTRNLRKKARGVTLENTSVNVVRYTEDGTTPVAGGPGKLLHGGDIKYIETYEAALKIKLIREGASDATVDVEYYR